MGNDNRVVVTNFDMPFWSIVGLMLKIALASVPAMVMLSFLAFFAMGILAGLAGVLGVTP